MYFFLFVNRKNKPNNVVFHQYISKWNKHTEILPPIICYETQNRTRNLTILLYQLIMDTVYNNHGDKRVMILYLQMMTHTIMGEGWSPGRLKSHLSK